MNLIIVESPTKAKTISRFVGKSYRVESSYGHVRDLPKGRLGIDILNNFEPQYVIPRKAQKRITALRKAAREAETLILATDEDREGEAIAWHLTEALGPNTQSKTTNPSESTNQNPSGYSDTFVASDRVQRIVFHEITPAAIAEALKNPRKLNTSLIDAQQARRVLDRIVGYKLSPFLWKKIARGLSAGRVQSAALRLIADREEEIARFVPEEYWTITALLKVQERGGKRKAEKNFEAILYKIGEEVIGEPGIKSKKDAASIAERLKRADFRVSKVERREVRKNPLPPFITSTLEQEAVKRLGFSSKKTMFLAQNLYEEGFISYMRTDSVNLSQEALNMARVWIQNNLPSAYHLSQPRTFKRASRLAQEAHEAIRPTAGREDLSRLPQSVGSDQQKLYELIWRRFIASQLPSAVFDATRIEIDAHAGSPPHYSPQTNGSLLKFDGFLNVWPTKFTEKELPVIQEDDRLSLKKIDAREHHTEPPPRYNEASLIKTLEENGVGRPSTYAPIIAILLERNYAEKNERRLYSTELGSVVSKLLKENFPEIVDIQFTAKMEEELDTIALGKKKWQNVIREFYDPFARHLEEKYESVAKHEALSEATDEKCGKCGKPMVVKFSRFGKFMACSGFPECKNIKSLKKPQSTGIKCPKCLEAPERKDKPGELIVRRVRNGRARGRIFWGCSRYPDCDHATWTNPASVETKSKSQRARRK